VVVYGPAYEDKNVAFIDELHNIMASWGPWLIGGGREGGGIQVGPYLLIENSLD
jgi:hypothetical protein